MLPMVVIIAMVLLTTVTVTTVITPTTTLCATGRVATHNSIQSNLLNVFSCATKPTVSYFGL